MKCNDKLTYLEISGHGVDIEINGFPHVLQAQNCFFQVKNKGTKGGNELVIDKGSALRIVHALNAFLLDCENFQQLNKNLEKLQVSASVSQKH